jgi:hypothetical protein
VWPHLVAFAASGILLVLAFGQPAPLHAQVLLWAFGPICGFSLWRLVGAWLLLRHARRRGWNLGLHDFLFGFADLAGGGTRRVPERAEWAALPACDATLDELDNLRVALGLARGVPVLPERDSRLVPVYTASVPELATLVRDVLVDEGYDAHIEGVTPGVYRFSWGTRVLVPALQADAARALLDARFDVDEASHAEHVDTSPHEDARP